MKHTKQLVAAALLGAVTSLGAAALQLGDARADVPTTVAFSGALNDESGPYTGPIDAVFRIYDAAAGGSEVWSETHDDVAVVDGVLNVQLGETAALDPVIFDGGSYYLEVALDGQTLSPRSAVGSVPYAQRATVADNLTGFDPNAYQQAITGSCPAGQAIGGIMVDGSVMCIPVGDGDITGVTANGGLIGGGQSGNVSVSIATGGVSSNHLGDGVVTAAKIAASAITSALIADGTISSADIGSGAVNGGHIANSSVASAHIVNSSILGVDIADGTIGPADIGNSAVNTSELANGAVTNEKRDYGASATINSTCGLFAVATTCPAGNNGDMIDCDQNPYPGAFCEYDSGCTELDGGLDNCGTADVYVRLQ